MRWVRVGIAALTLTPSHVMAVDHEGCRDAGCNRCVEMIVSHVTARTEIDQVDTGFAFNKRSIDPLDRVAVTFPDLVGYSEEGLHLAFADCLLSHPDRTPLQASVHFRSKGGGSILPGAASKVPYSAFQSAMTEEQYRAMQSSRVASLGIGFPKVDEVLEAFSDNCFDPRLVHAKATRLFAGTFSRVEFYDLTPFSDAAPSPVTGRAATPGTDRRCEVAFDGDEGVKAAETAASGLEAEGILSEATLPETHANAALPGTTLLAARYLNPNRIAVVHTGTRPGPNGIETFLTVERLTPEASQ